MAKRYVNVQVSLVDLTADSDSDAPVHPPVPQAPPSPAASSTQSRTRTPRRFPTVSDDDSEIPIVSRSPTPSPPRNPSPRSVLPSPRAAAPASPPRVAQVPHYPTPAARGPYPVRGPASIHPPPHTALGGCRAAPYSVYEHGESSHQASTRRMDALSVQMRDTRYAYHEMQISQGRMMNRLIDVERDTEGWRDIVGVKVRLGTERMRRRVFELREQMVVTEWCAALAFLFSFIAVAVAVFPYFYRQA